MGDGTTEALAILREYAAGTLGAMQARVLLTRIGFRQSDLDVLVKRPPEEQARWDRDTVLRAMVTAAVAAYAHRANVAHGKSGEPQRLYLADCLATSFRIDVTPEDLVEPLKALDTHLTGVDGQYAPVTVSAS